MVALSTVLGLIKVIHMPLGGDVTLLSMLPMIVLSVSLGVGWGLAGAFAYSLVQLIFGIAADGLLGWGLSGWQLALCIMLDYILAYTALGLAGVFGKGKYSPLFGTALVLVFHFICHFLSGYIIFANFEKFVVFGKAFLGRPLLYSACYNGTYMLPETVITCIAVFVLIKMNFFERMKKF